MRSKILIILLFCSNLLFAQSITVTGYGNSKDKALKSAFQNAVEQEVGVLVDTKTVIRNNKLIKNKILTYSNGFIKDYKEVSAKQQMGFWTVKISAVVEHQKLLSKLKKIKINPRQIKGTKKLYAQVVSQVKTKFDAEAIFKKFYRTFTSVPIENYYAEVTDFKIDTDLATRKTVPVKISYEVKYKQSEIVKRQLSTARELMQKLSVCQDIKKNTSVWDSLTSNNSCIGNNYISVQYDSLEPFNYLLKHKHVDYYFPRSYSVIYPFNKSNGFGNAKRKRVGYVELLFLNKNNVVLKKIRIKNYKYTVYSMVYDHYVREDPATGLKQVTYTKSWNMPISYLKKITQVKARIIWQ